MWSTSAPRVDSLKVAGVSPHDNPTTWTLPSSCLVTNRTCILSSPGTSPDTWLGEFQFTGFTWMSMLDFVSSGVVWTYSVVVFNPYSLLFACVTIASAIADTCSFVSSQHTKTREQSFRKYRGSAEMSRNLFHNVVRPDLRHSKFLPLSLNFFIFSLPHSFLI